MCQSCQHGLSCQRLYKVQACGSGGTAAGVALGAYLSSMQAHIHAFGVCDDPDYFYSYIDDLFQGLGATKEAVGECLLSLWPWNGIAR